MPNVPRRITKGGFNMILRCWVCVTETTRATKLQDPRRGKGEDIAYVLRMLCSLQCEEEAVEELDKKSQIVRLT